MNRAFDLPASFREHALGAGVTIEGQPQRKGNELRWQVRLADGRGAQLGALVQELARDESLRRRYLRDLAQLAATEPQGVAPLLAWGQAQGESPWRLSLRIEGEALDAWMLARSPAPIDESLGLLAQLCDCLAGLHARGQVLRDLSPSKLVLDPAGKLWLVDIGLARTDILSTRTAASLVLEGSPYTAPELLMRTAVDGRADLYALGTLAFRMLTGELPYADTHALLRPEGPPPRPSLLRPELPRRIDALVVSLLEAKVEHRPESADLVAAILRGDRDMPNLAIEALDCQNCGTPMPEGQRLCLRCGKQAVLFRHATDAVAFKQRRKLVLRRVHEKGDYLRCLREISEELCEGEVPTMNFLVGDARMYSKSELKEKLRLPLTLFNDLDEDTANDLQARFEAKGVKTLVEPQDATDRSDSKFALSRKQVRTGLALGACTALSFTAALVAGAPLVPAAAIVGGVGAFMGGIFAAGVRAANVRRLNTWHRSLMGLRKTPVALPASDPLVARLAGLLDDELSPEVHVFVSRLALLIQRMVDHRAANLGAAAEIELATSPLAQLVEAFTRQVKQARHLEESLAQLDEGRLVRALAASQAKDEPESAREPLLHALDRLRELEVRRAATLTALSEACDLARRSVELGLRVQDPAAEHERQVQLALHALTRGDENSD